MQDDLGEAESISAIADILLSQHRYGDLEPLYVRKLHLAQATSNHAHFWRGLFWTWPAFTPGNIGTRKQTRPISEAWRSIVSLREI